ncbi:Glutathione S-transferase protein [Entophlyctis luteolus]|nr:Glutathione S-transferase protein [Entophlyctis luteolus]
MDVHSLIEIVPYAVDPTKTGAVSQPNPLNKIPALDVDGIGAIYGSQVIVQYLLSLNPAKAGAFLAREGDPQRYLTLTLESLADGMTDALILCRFEEHLRPAELRWESWLAGQKAKVIQVELSKQLLNDP